MFEAGMEVKDLKTTETHKLQIQTVKRFRIHRGAPHISEISQVAGWYEPPRLSALSATDLGSVYL